MCGLFGFMAGAKYTSKVRKLMEELTIVDTLRGSDGTGMAVLPDTRDELVIHKRGLWGPEFLTTNGYQKILAPVLSDARIIIGHNRAASSNNLGDHRAHPFVERHITLVHNGFISNAYSITPKGYGPDVDSMAAAYVIAEHGEKAGLEKLKGAFALVWYNSEDKTLNIARNEDRELVLAFLDDGSMFWMSEMDLLWAILNRNDKKMNGLFKIVPTFTHLKFPIGMPQEFTRTPFLRPQTQLSSSVQTPTERAAWEHWGHNTQGENTNQSSAKKTGKIISGESTADDSTETYNDEADPTAGRLPQASWFTLTDQELSKVHGRFQELSRVAPKGCCIPTSKGKIKATSLKLAKVGVTIGQQMCVTPEGWDLYTNQRENGAVRARRTYNESFPVQIPWIDKETWAKMQTAKSVYVTVVNLKVNKKQGRTTIMGVLDYMVHKKDEQRPILSLAGKKTTANEIEEAITEREKAQTVVYVRGPVGSFITERAFLELTRRHGCGSCGETVNPDDAVNCTWQGDSVLCPECSTYFVDKLKVN